MNCDKIFVKGAKVQRCKGAKVQKCKSAVKTESSGDGKLEL